MRTTCCDDNEVYVTPKQLQREVVVPLILGMITFSVILVFIRYKLSTLARPHHFLALFALGRVPTHQDLQSVWQGPEGDPPPDYTAAVNMPSPVHKDDGNESSENNVGKVFFVEIPEAEAEPSENNDTEDQVPNVESLVTRVRRSSTFDEDTETEEAELHTHHAYTNEIILEEMDTPSKDQTSGINDEIASEVSHNQQEPEHTSSIAVFNLHKMDYNPEYPQRVLPTYDEYIKDFTCVHL